MIMDLQLSVLNQIIIKINNVKVLLKKSFNILSDKISPIAKFFFVFHLPSLKN